MQNRISTNQNIIHGSLKQRKLNKFNHLKHERRQTQQYLSKDKESNREDQTAEKRQILYAAAVRKGNNSKTNLFRKKSNTNILISFDKSSSNENNKTPISQQIDLRQRQQEVMRKKVCRNTSNSKKQK